MRKVLPVLLSLCLHLFHPGQGQHYNFQNYTVEQGLPQSQVMAIFQDSKSNLWLGTNGGGLCRFTGKGFDVYTRKHGLGSDLVTEIIEDQEGNLVIRTVNGITVFNGKTFTEYPLDTTRNVNISNLHLDRNGDVWFMAFLDNTAPTLFRFDGDSLSRESDKNDLFKKLTFQNTLTGTRNGDLLISVGQALYIYDGRDFKPHPVSNDSLLDGKTITFMHEMVEGGILTATIGGQGGNLVTIGNDVVTSMKLPDPLRSGSYGFFFEDNEGSFWLLSNTNGNLYRWNRLKDGSIEIITPSDGIPTRSLRSMHHDTEGNIWFGTDGSGLFKYGGSKFISYLSNQGLEDYFVWSIFEDSEERMWFGTSNNAVILYDGNQMEVIQGTDDQPFDIIRSIGEFNGEILLGAFSGLWALRDNTFIRVNEEYGLPANLLINDLLVHNNRLFISTAGRGLAIIDRKGSIRYFNTDNSGIGGNILNDITIAGDGSIWFSTPNGINHFDGSQIRHYSCTDDFGSARIMQLALDKAGNIWVATYGFGLCKVPIGTDDKVAVEIVDQDHGLSSNNVYSVIADMDGNIWAGCQNGVDKLTIDGGGMVSNIRNYDNYEGFTGFENNGKANLIDSKGNLWFGTIKGVMVYDSERDIKNEKPPVTRVMNIKLFYKDVDWGEKSMAKTYTELAGWTGLPQALTLPYNKNHLSFGFEGLSYAVPEKVKFQWMLEGLDEDWSPPDTRSDAVYANLPPGEYTFKVRAGNNDGIWNAEPATYQFIIRPPFYATWWFRTILVVFIASLIAVVSWLRNKFIQEKREELEQLVAFKTKKLEQQKDEILQKNDELSRQYTNLELLSKIGRDITANLTLESLLDSIYEKLNELMDAAVLGFGIFEKDKNRLEFPVLISKGKKISIPPVDYTDKNSLAVQCLSENREIKIDDFKEEYSDVRDSWKPPVKGDDSMSIIFIPLIHHDNPLGVLTVQSVNPRAYNEYHLNILRNLAIYAKIALENANAYEKIQEHRNHLSKANEDIISQKLEIEKSNMKLVELNDEKNNIIEIVAHDLKNPLTSALTMADILKSESDNLEDDQKHCIMVIEKSIKRMNDMINRLLDVRKIEDKIVELKLEKVNLKELIKDVNNMLVNEINRKKIRLSIEAEELYAKIDHDYAIQIFENLISNAIKFSPPKRNVTIKLVKDNGKARTEIIDEGPGLTVEDHTRVFGKFQRLSARPTGGEQSTGLGLSIVKRYVEAMNGKVWCESEHGKGANFIVEFARVD